MAQRVNAINNAFGNCVFISKDIDSVTKTIVEKINEHDVFTEKPTEIKMSRIDDMHDRLSLTFSNGKLDGVISWRKTAAGNHFVFDNFKADA